MAVSSYPTTIDTFVDKQDNRDDILANDINQTYAALSNIERTLGKNPQGSGKSIESWDVARRLNTALESSGALKSSSVGNLAITVGAVSTRHINQTDTFSFLTTKIGGPIGSGAAYQGAAGDASYPGTTIDSLGNITSEGTSTLSNITLAESDTFIADLGKENFVNILGNQLLKFESGIPEIGEGVYTYSLYNEEEYSVTSLNANFTTGVDNVSAKIPTVLTVAAVVLILGVLVLLVAAWQRMNLGGGGI